MRKKKYLFVGVRTNVLNYMLDHLQNVIAILPQNKQIDHDGLAQYSIGTKNELIELIGRLDFDILVSNGCPYILPVSKIKKPHQIFINLHPSILPNFRGLHPVNAAIFYEKKTGATCHIMDDSIDGGKIISQIHVQNNSTVRLPLLYQLCFLAEVQAFKKALELKFIPLTNQPKDKNSFFQRKDIDQNIDLQEISTKEFIQRIRALSIEGQYASIMIENTVYVAKSVSIVKNSFLYANYLSNADNTIVLKYDHFILIKKEKEFLEIEVVNNDKRI